MIPFLLLGQYIMYLWSTWLDTRTEDNIWIQTAIIPVSASAHGCTKQYRKLLLRIACPSMTICMPHSIDKRLETPCINLTLCMVFASWTLSWDWKFDEHYRHQILSFYQESRDWKLALMHHHKHSIIVIFVSEMMPLFPAIWNSSSTCYVHRCRRLCISNIIFIKNCDHRPYNPARSPLIILRPSFESGRWPDVQD